MNFNEWKQLAEQGKAEAQYNLGLMYSLGKDIPKNDPEAIKWYLRAAEQGFAEAQTNLGLMYGKGQGIEQNFNEAVKWYRLAAEQD